jgi:NADPH:quinone reductase-like Zn-dependent oxidoreductase
MAGALGTPVTRVLFCLTFLASGLPSFYPLYPMLLKSQVALVTGSGRGIGRAIARLFAKEGASVFLTARTESELTATAVEIGDLTGDREAAAFATADLAQEAGRIDVLVTTSPAYPRNRRFRGVRHTRRPRRACWGSRGSPRRKQRAKEYV